MEGHLLSTERQFMFQLGIDRSFSLLTAIESNYKKKQKQQENLALFDGGSAKCTKFITPEYPRRNRLVKRYDLDKIFKREDFYLQDDYEVLDAFFCRSKPGEQSVRLPMLCALPEVEINQEFVKNARVALA